MKDAGRDKIVTRDERVAIWFALADSSNDSADERGERWDESEDERKYQ